MYIYVHSLNSYPNILADKVKFKIRTDSVTQGLPYDFHSCMHVRYNAFSKNNLRTIFPKNFSIPLTVMGASVWPSEQDYLDLNLSYCGERIVPQ